MLNKLIKTLNILLLVTSQAVFAQLLNPGGELEIYLQTDYLDPSSLRSFTVKVIGHHWDEYSLLTELHSDISLTNVDEDIEDTPQNGWDLVGTSTPGPGINSDSISYGLYIFYESSHPTEKFYLDYRDCNLHYEYPIDIILKYKEVDGGPDKWYYKPYDDPNADYIQIVFGETIPINEILDNFPPTPSTSCFAPYNFDVILYPVGGSYRPKLTWDLSTAPNLEGYELYRSYNGMETWNTIAELPSNSTSYIDYDTYISQTKNCAYAHYAMTAFTTSQISDTTNPQVVRYDDGCGELLPKPLMDYELRLIPESFTLYQNFPNPFNSSTTIMFDLPEESRISLSIYTITGEEVISKTTETSPAGFKEIIWNGNDRNGQPVPSGMYIYVIKAQSNEGILKFRESRKMVLVR